MVRAPWPVNVSDSALLPPPEELRSLPMDVLLAVLASTRPIHDALEAALRKGDQAQGRPGHDEFDALARFDSERMLLTRTRRMARSEEHTSELQSLMRIPYAAFCLK